MSSILITLCFSFFIFFSSAAAYRFNVGGSGVWIPNPIESYQTWSAKTRFQIHDTIYFKYPKGSDSVQQVMKADFDGCNTRNPLKSYSDGETVIELEQSGPLYFISGKKNHCKKGQKLIVTVLSPRTPLPHPPAPSPSPSSSSANPPKSSSPLSPATPPTKAQPPKSSSPVAPKKSPATPPRGSSSPSASITPAEPPKAEKVPSSGGITAPAPSPKSSANGVTVISVMTTLSTVAFTLFMFA